MKPSPQIFAVWHCILHLVFWMLTFRMLIFPMLLRHLKFETLKPWNLKSGTSIFLVPSNLDISNADISHINSNLKPWNCKSFNSSFRCLSCSPHLNLIFRMLTFRMLTFPMLLCHQAFLLSKTKCAVLKYEMCRFKYENCGNFKYEKCVNYK